MNNGNARPKSNGTPRGPAAWPRFVQMEYGFTDKDLEEIAGADVIPRGDLLLEEAADRFGRND
ncbi:MAG: hypothetical protein ACYTG0_33465 [Planctomycetota bacterium]